MTFVVKASRKLARLQKGKEDWRDVLKPSLTHTDDLPQDEQALADCRHAFTMGGHEGALSYPALFNHFAMWLYPMVPEGHPEYEYCLTVKEIRAKLFTSQCYLKGANKDARTLGSEG